jgi:chromosome partitioning protein
MDRAQFGPPGDGRRPDPGQAAAEQPGRERQRPGAEDAPPGFPAGAPGDAGGDGSATDPAHDTVTDAAYDSGGEGAVRPDDAHLHADESSQLGQRHAHAGVPRGTPASFGPEADAGVSTGPPAGPDPETDRSDEVSRLMAGMAAPGREAAHGTLDELDGDPRHATVICVANQKGGVGKTTTAVSLGAALAMEGAQVLVVDLDPQGNATTGLGLRAQEGAPSTYRVLVEQMDVEDASEPTAVKGLHVLPSSLDLAGAEIELVPAFSRELRLKQALDAVRDLYDVVLIDCPPSLGLLTINALAAADQVLVPIQCEYYALEGLGQLLRTVKLVGESLNRELTLGGVVLTMFDGRTNLSQQVVDEVRSYFGETAFQTIVPRTVRLSEAPSYGQPIAVFDASSRGARAYQRLAREVARRLGLSLESQDVSPLDRLLGSVTAAGPAGSGMSPEAADDGALPSDLHDIDLADLEDTSQRDHHDPPYEQHAHDDERHAPAQEHHDHDGGTAGTEEER